MVYDVVMVFPGEIVQNVVVSITTETVDVATEGGNTDEADGCGNDDGVADTVTV